MNIFKVRFNKLTIMLLFSLFLIGTSLKAEAGMWASVGPGGGEIRAMVLSPNFPSDQTLFAGAFYGAFFGIRNQIYNQRNYFDTK